MTQGSRTCTSVDRVFLPTREGNGYEGTINEPERLSRCKMKGSAEGGNTSC